MQARRRGSDRGRRQHGRIRLGKGLARRLGQKLRLRLRLRLLEHRLHGMENAPGRLHHTVGPGRVRERGERASDKLGNEIVANNGRRRGERAGGCKEHQQVPALSRGVSPAQHSSAKTQHATHATANRRKANRRKKRQPTSLPRQSCWAGSGRRLRDRGMHGSYRSDRA